MCFVPIGPAVVMILLFVVLEKSQRLKEAKEEAQKEIKDYRAERERLFQEKQQSNAGSKDNFKQKMEREVIENRKKMEQEVRVGKDKVIQRLLEMVYKIEPEMHINARR